MKNKKLEEILDKISGIFDLAYENAADEEEEEYINSVENELYDWLYDVGYIEREEKQ